MRFDRGQPSGRYEALRRKHFTLPNNVSHRKLVESTLAGLGAWNWGVVPQYPPCPYKRFRRVSWQTGQFSAANLVSLRSWEAELLSVRQDVQETANSPTVHLWVVCSSCKTAHNLARRWPAKRGGCRWRWSFVRHHRGRLTVAKCWKTLFSSSSLFVEIFCRVWAQIVTGQTKILNLGTAEQLTVRRSSRIQQISLPQYSIRSLRQRTSTLDVYLTAARKVALARGQPISEAFRKERRWVYSKRISGQRATSRFRCGLGMVFDERFSWNGCMSSRGWSTPWQWIQMHVVMYIPARVHKNKSMQHHTFGIWHGGISSNVTSGGTY